MDINLQIQGRHITFEREHVFIAKDELQLLADIEKPILIQEGEYARIPTPITIGGGRRAVMAVAFVAAGLQGDSYEEGRGQFFVPPQDGEMTIEVDVINRTGGILTIQPCVGLGVLSFRAIQMEGGAVSETDDADDDETHVAETIGALPMRAVYRPEFIDAAITPQYETAGAAAFDLRADLEAAVVLAPGERSGIATGLAMEIPDGFEGQIRPRSGLALRHGISVTNSPATIDSDYRGEIKVVLHNLGQEPYTVEPGARIAQMLIAPVARAVVEYVDSLDETARGSGGFGSTGKN